MSIYINQVSLKGNLSKEPVARTVGSGNSQFTAVNFTVAVNKPDRKQADGSYLKGKASFIDCTATGTTADTIVKYLHKGDEIYIKDGELEVDSWMDGEVKRTKMKVVVHSFQFGTKAKAKDNTYNSAQEENDYSAPDTLVPEDLEVNLDMIDRSDLPF